MRDYVPLLMGRQGRSVLLLCREDAGKTVKVDGSSVQYGVQTWKQTRRSDL